MIYPEHFESKIGFDRIRELVKSHCMFEPGRERVDEMAFMTDHERILRELRLVEEFHELFYIGAGPRYRFSVSVHRNYSSACAMADQLADLYYSNGLLIPGEFRAVHFPFDRTKVYNFFDHSGLLERAFDVQLPAREEDVHVHDGEFGDVRAAKLSRIERARVPRDYFRLFKKAIDRGTEGLPGSLVALLVLCLEWLVYHRATVARLWGKARALLFSEDSAAATQLEPLAREKGIGTGKLPTKELLGELLERRPTGVVAVTDGGLAGALLRTVQRLEALK